MRKILSEGSNTVINELSAGASSRATPKADRNLLRSTGRLVRAGCLAVLWSLLVSTPVLAASDEAAAERAPNASNPAASVQSAGRHGAIERRQSGPATAGKAGPADAKRVYLDDYQLIPQAVTKQRPTKMVWLGQKSKTR